MRTLRTVGLSVLVVAILAFGLLPAASAQDDMAVSCDSTLVTLLLVAEHDYGYLSHMMDSEMAPNVDYGQFSHLITDIVARMQAMGMSDEDMATAEAMQMAMDAMMAMSTDEILHSYDMAMMEDDMSGEMMTALTPGNVAGENELCTTLRADVEKFLVAHIVNEVQSMPMDDM